MILGLGPLILLLLGNTEDEFGLSSYQQGPRIFLTSDKNKTYILFVKGIAQIHPKTYKIKMLAESPVEISSGGDILNGRIYFAGGSHLYSYRLP